MTPDLWQQHQIYNSFLSQMHELMESATQHLARQDSNQLGRVASDMLKLASKTDQVLIQVQLQLLEQAVTLGQSSRVGKILDKIRNSLAQITLAPLQTSDGEVDFHNPFAIAALEDKKLGDYLIEADLLSPSQVEVALADQEVTGMRFGDVVVSRGWLKPRTIEYIMQKVVIPDRQQQMRTNKGLPLRPGQMNPDRPQPPPQRPKQEPVNYRETFLDVDSDE